MNWSKYVCDCCNEDTTGDAISFRSVKTSSDVIVCQECVILGQKLMADNVRKRSITGQVLLTSVSTMGVYTKDTSNPCKKVKKVG